MSDHTSNDHPGDSRLAANPTVSNWERETLEKLVFATVQERRAARRWGIFFKLSFLLVALLALWAYYDFNFGGTGDESLGRHTALIEINGEIEAEGSGAADTVIPSLNKAFSDSGSAAVVLRIDSPGGSPVQAGIIVDEIQRLKRGYPDKPLYVVVDEICASGGYYIASAADRIYVNKASIVGSVGVLMDSFGFTGTMDKLGVERRLMTAGENKGFLDPFSPQSDKHKAHAQAMLNEIHQQFISVVRAGRGKRLKETPETFSGLYWTGAKAVEMGLADGFGTVDTVARDIVKAEDIVDYTAHEGLPERVLKKFGAAVGENAVKAATRGTLPKLH
ncbi:S49 family peptidase [Massilia sp. AB1]|uniref:S49 family peptidase n=1 Tax=Massilia sp. AB1 TaxID=2823371 RepID=UPI001B841A56|nr:S49 family peptidase [Massilia sp. AB1]MBQ5939653.1 S49 family peptidase [Massilia sp. AB1]